MNKRRIFLFLTLLTIGCILIFLCMFFNGKEEAPHYTVFEKIGFSRCVKFERFSNDGTQYEPIISNSGTLTLGDFFSSLLIIEHETQIGSKCSILSTYLFKSHCININYLSGFLMCSGNFIDHGNKSSRKSLLVSSICSGITSSKYLKYS